MDGIGIALTIAMVERIPTFTEIIEAPLEDIRFFVLQGHFIAFEHKNYAKVLKSYLSGDSETLKSILLSLEKGTPVYEIGMLRLQNLENQLDREQIATVENLVKADNLWSGEAAFALGMTYLRFKMNREAKVSFSFARVGLRDIGAMKKSVKALLNVVVSDSRIDNTKKLIGDYMVVAKEAARAGDPIVEGICYQNISKEVHVLGAFQTALDYSNKALRAMEKDVGSLHYFESLLQRCHVLIDLNRFREAYLDFEFAKTSTHPHIKEALKCIETLLGSQKKIQTDYLEPAWRTKLKSFDKNIKRKALTKSEVQLIELLVGGMIERDTAILALYGDNIDWESAKNRFKVFLTRLRKKYPNLLIEENGCLFLSDTSVLGRFEDIA